MLLADVTIKKLIADGTLRIDPYDVRMVQPCSLDIRLGNLDTKGKTVLGLMQWSVKPNQFVLGVTMEHIVLPRHIAATVTGKSTFGRLGLSVHQTAGHCDPGFDGDIVLELKNVSDKPVLVTEGQAIGQLLFTYLDIPAEQGYNGKYQFQHGIKHAQL